MNDTKLDKTDTMMESSVSIAVVRPDHGAVVDRIKDAVNVAAAIISATNPAAGLALKTAAILGGWVFQERKYSRIKDALTSGRKPNPAGRARIRQEGGVCGLAGRNAPPDGGPA